MNFQTRIRFLREELDFSEKKLDDDDDHGLVFAQVQGGGSMMMTICHWFLFKLQGENSMMMISCFGFA